MDQFNIPSSAPPPPSEVKVRTMHSDIDAMTKSGGGMPQFETVRVSGLSIENASNAPVANPTGKSSNTAAIIIVSLVIVAVLAFGSYLAYRTFFSGAAPSQGQAAGLAEPTSSLPENPVTSPSAVPASVVVATNTASSAPSSSAAPAAMPPLATPATTTPFTHVSLFKKPADQAIAVTFADGESVQNVADLLTYGQKLQNAVAEARASASFIEIDGISPVGQDLSIEDLLNEAGAAILDQDVLLLDFNQDATFFVYRDEGGIWPGYVLSLREGQNLVTASQWAEKMESSSNIGNLFLTSVGTPNVSGFTNSTISGVAVRELSFDGMSSARFVYGWDKELLVISTSEAGFAQAVAHLP